MTDIEKQIDAISKIAKEVERLRVATWLMQRANLIMNADPAGALELSICANAIKDDKMGPTGMHADEPKLQYRKAKDKFEAMLDAKETE